MEVVVILVEASFFLLVPGVSVRGRVVFSGATVVIRGRTGIVGEGGEMPRVLPPTVFAGAFKDIAGVETKP